MEALLLLWETGPRYWTIGELAERLFVPEDAAEDIARGLAAKGLVIAGSAGRSWQYATDPERDRMMRAVAETYRRELARISDLIHSKGADVRPGSTAGREG